MQYIYIIEERNKGNRSWNRIGWSKNERKAYEFAEFNSGKTTETRVRKEVWKP